MNDPRLHWLSYFLLGASLTFLSACKNDPIEVSLQEQSETPIEHIWFEDVLSFLGRMHAALDHPSSRVELRLQLLAGQEALALKRLGIAPQEFSELLLRLEQNRADLESRWPELREHTAYGGESGYPMELIGMLASETWPTTSHTAVKPPLEYVCASLELYDNLSRCGSWNAIAQAFCMYQAYLRYLQHLSLGCGG